MSTVPAGLGHSAFIDTFGVLRSTVVSDTPHREHKRKPEYMLPSHSQMHLSSVFLQASLLFQTGSHYSRSHPITDGFLTHQRQLQMNQE